MINTKWLLISTILLTFNTTIAQGLFSEVGLGVGNVTGEEHKKGKAEIHFNVLKPYNFGEIGLDISIGGNFIPGNLSSIENSIETLSPNDAKITSISAFYRLPIIKKIYFEPRAGYSTLFYFINADNKSKIAKSNITYGLGIGATLTENLSVSFRYQHVGNTPNYVGNKGSTMIISKSETLNLIFLRASYRFNWDSVF